MEKNFGQNNPDIAQYAEDVFRPEDQILREVKMRTEKEGLPPIQVSPMDGLHLEVITRAINAKKAVEIGTLGGYSGICILRGMGPEGKLYTFEISEKNASVAKESFRRSGFEKNTEIILGPAALSLPTISRFAPFDFVFIDADKESYPYYLKWASENLKMGGVVLADNTFAFGDIANPTINDPQKDPSVFALRDFNRGAAQEGYFRATILPTGEGLTMAVKVR